MVNLKEGFCAQKFLRAYQVFERKGSPKIFKDVKVFENIEENLKEF
jgi:hypothetical protein